MTGEEREFVRARRPAHHSDHHVDLAVAVEVGRDEARDGPPGRGPVGAEEVRPCRR